MELFFVFRPIVVTDNRRYSNGITHKNSRKNIGHIHDDAIGGNPFRPNISEKLSVIANPNNRSCDARNEFADSIGASFG